MLRATGWQGGRTPRLIPERGQCVRAGGGYEVQEGFAAEAMMSANREYSASLDVPGLGPSAM